MHPKRSFHTVLIAALLFLLVSTVHAEKYINVSDIQQAIEDSGANWVAKDNPMVRKSLSDIQNLLSFTMPIVSPDDTFFVPGAITTLPSSLDWRNNGGNFITPVRDQGSCGSCWAFSAVAATEANNAIAAGTPNPTTDLSEQHLLSCSDGGSCGGGWPEEALTYILDTGTPDESCFPYSATDESCSHRCDDWESRTSTIRSWSWVTTTNYNSVELIKEALAEGPLSTTMMIYEDFLAYDSGVYSHVTGAFLGGHAILLVGWNDAEQAWIAKNSWDTWWGMDGYFKIRFGEVEFGAYSVSVTGVADCDGCFIDSVCYAHGQLNPANECQFCDSASDEYDWSANDGISCDDGSICTSDDYCEDGVCTGIQMDCSDGVFCNGREVCDEQTGQCTDGGPACSDDQICDEDEGKCLDDDDDVSGDEDSEDEDDPSDGRNRQVEEDSPSFGC